MCRESAEDLKQRYTSIRKNLDTVVSCVCHHDATVPARATSDLMGIQPAGSARFDKILPYFDVAMPLGPEN
jgi:hypothetical protein